MNTELKAFYTRDSRSQYILNRFSEQLKQTILDVGCFEAPLRKLLPNADYTGIDIAGNPDIELNLETAERLPVEDSAYNCALCIDVLEHLDSLHRVYKELFRVSQQWVIVSLPNCWGGARRPIGRGKGDFMHYGLPFERPVDRHKWFFGCTDAKLFFEQTAHSNPDWSIHELFATEKPKNLPTRLFRHLAYPGERYQNRYTNTVWAVFKKIKAE